MATLDDLRDAALALPEVVEAPHFSVTSFRVNGRIVAQETTHRTDGTPHAIVNVDAGRAEILVEVRPDVFDWAVWGSHRSLRVRLPQIEADELGELVRDAWLRLAPKKLHARLRDQDASC